jgi:hypothetical protein
LAELENKYNMIELTISQAPENGLSAISLSSPTREMVVTGTQMETFTSALQDFDKATFRSNMNQVAHLPEDKWEEWLQTHEEI